MQKRIKDIIILYNEKDAQIIDKVIKIINNNYSLTKSILDGNDILDLRENPNMFEEEFNCVIKATYTNPNIEKMYKNKEIIRNLHIEALLKRNNIQDSAFKNDDSFELSDDFISTFIAYAYFDENGNFDDFIEYIKVKDKEDKLFEWLSNKCRWNTFNYLLEVVIETLNSTDDDFFHRSSYILKYWLNRSYDSNNYNEDSKVEYPKIDRSEFDKLFYEFLRYINAPASWAIAYNNLKENELITFETNSKTENSQYYIDDNKTGRILVSYSDTIKGFYNFVHEFTHYISKEHETLFSNKIVIIEVATIFFEKICVNFLKEKGYDEDTVNSLLKERENYIYTTCRDLIPLFSPIFKYATNGKITREEEINFYKDQIEQINQSRKEILEMFSEIEDKDLKSEFDSPSVQEDLEYLKEYIEIDVEKAVDNDCDSLINGFLEDGLLVINGYQYLVGAYISEQLLEKMKTDDRIIPSMIDLTNHLSIADIKDIIKQFGIEDYSNNDTELIKKIN